MHPGEEKFWNPFVETGGEKTKYCMIRIWVMWRNVVYMPGVGRKILTFQRHSAPLLLSNSWIRSFWFSLFCPFPMVRIPAALAIAWHPAYPDKPNLLQLNHMVIISHVSIQIENSFSCTGESGCMDLFWWGCWSARICTRVEQRQSSERS